jgi:hypothetical protein
MEAEMKRTLMTVLAAGLALSAAVPALAGDLIFPGGTGLTEGLAGQTYWSTQAQCAGLYGATNNYLSERGDTAQADAAKAKALGFAEDAIQRVMADRKLSRADAVQIVAPAILAGRNSGLQTLAAGGMNDNSTWNFARSACLDIAEIYKSASR